MSNNKQSSIEWLKQRVLYIVPSSQKDDLIKLFEQAEDMHKEEHDKTSEVWFNEGTNVHNGRKYQNFEQYYKDTFKECKD